MYTEFGFWYTDGYKVTIRDLGRNKTHLSEYQLSYIGSLEELNSSFLLVICAWTVSESATFSIAKAPKSDGWYRTLQHCRPLPEAHAPSYEQPPTETLN